MFRMKPRVPSNLQQAIDEVLERMSQCDHPNSDEYTHLLEKLEKLYKLKETDTKSAENRRVSADTAALVAGNLAGIVLIVGHERAHVITSKAVAFVKALK